MEYLSRTAVALFEDHGYEAVTMKQLAATADVPKDTLYNHFPVRETVLAHWLQLKTRSGSAAGALHVLKHSANWCETLPDYLAPYLPFRFLGIGTEPSPSRDNEQLSDIAANFHWPIRRGQTSGEIRGDLDPACLTVGFHHIYLGAMLRWLADPRLKLRKEFAAAVELFLRDAAAPANASPKPKKKGS